MIEKLTLSTDDEPKCGNCKYFKPMPANTGGWCRRNPPYAQMMTMQNQLGQTQLTPMSFWPQMGDTNECCGEHSPAPKKFDA